MEVIQKGCVASVTRSCWKIIDKNSLCVFDAILNNSYKCEDLPLVGDNVEYITDQWGNNFIINLLPRKNIIKRYSKNINKPLVANVDIVFVVSSLNKDFELEKLERLALLGVSGNAKVGFILTKVDKCPNIDTYIKELKERFKTEPIFAINSKNKASTVEIFKFWKEGETAVFMGSSGVGKSTLVNTLLDKEILKTAEVRDVDDRGKHTTTARYLIAIEGGRWVIDTPGIRSIQSTTEADPVDIFDEIRELEKQCKYKDCSHTKEDNCAVLNALENGNLDKIIYERFIKLKQGLNVGTKQAKTLEKKQSKLLKSKRIQSKNKKILNKKHQ